MRRFPDLLDTIIAPALGIILLISGSAHWNNPYYFLGTIYSYELVGPGLGQLVAMILPTLQIILASCMIFRVCVRTAYSMTAALMGVFATVQFSAYARGLNIACGCFGPAHEVPVGYRSLLVVVPLFLVSIAGAFFSSRRPIPEAPELSAYTNSHPYISCDTPALR